MYSIFFPLILIIVYLNIIDANIKVQNKKLYYGTQQVFLSGTNMAWYKYAKQAKLHLIIFNYT